jgi:hypothetical protein
MDFYAVLDQVVDLLRSRQRATYRTLKRQFNLDDAALEERKRSSLPIPRLWMKTVGDWCGLVTLVRHPPPLSPHHLAQYRRHTRHVSRSPTSLHIWPRSS